MTRERDRFASKLAPTKASRSGRSLAESIGLLGASLLANISDMPHLEA